MSTDIGLDGKACGPLEGAPLREQRFTMGGFPVATAVAYTHSRGASNLVSPFAEQPKFIPYNNDALKRAVIRFAASIKQNPTKSVWACETDNGSVELYLGDYGNVKGGVSLGYIVGTHAAQNPNKWANLTCAEVDAEEVRQGRPPMFSSPSTIRMGPAPFESTPDYQLMPTTDKEERLALYEDVMSKLPPITLWERIKFFVSRWLSRDNT